MSYDTERMTWFYFAEPSPGQPWYRVIREVNPGKVQRVEYDFIGSAHRSSKIALAENLKVRL